VERCVLIHILSKKLFVILHTMLVFMFTVTYYIYLSNVADSSGHTVYGAL